MPEQSATQLSRPEIYAEEDERIAHAGEKGASWAGEEEKANGETTMEQVV